jgi:hypothetical protein
MLKLTDFNLPYPKALAPKNFSQADFKCMLSKKGNAIRNTTEFMTVQTPLTQFHDLGGNV